MRTYIVYLSRHKLYTSIIMLGKVLVYAFCLLAMSFVVKHLYTDSHHENAERIYLLGCDKGNWSSYWASRYVMENFDDRVEAATSISRYSEMYIGDNKEIEQNVLLVDSLFFDIFSYDIIAGDIEEFKRGEGVAIVSEEYAEERYGEKSVTGETIELRGIKYEIIGVMRAPENTVLEANIIASAAEHIRVFDQGDPEMHTYGYNLTALLLKNDVDIEALEEDLNNFFVTKMLILQTGYIKRLKLENFNKAYLGGGYGQLFRQGNAEGLLLIIAIAAMLAVFAVFNYISLNLMHSESRSRQMAIRQLMGESKIDILKRLMMESTLMSGMGITLGIIAAWALSDKASEMMDYQFMVFDEFRWWHYVFVMVVSGVLTMIASIAPTVIMLKSNPIDIERSVKKNHVKRGGFVMTMQYALCFTMLIPTICLWLQTSHLKNAPLGYETDNLLVLEPITKDRIEEMRDTLLKLECVEKVGLCESIPLEAYMRSIIDVDGEEYYVTRIMGDSTYMEMLGLRKKEVLTDMPTEGNRREGNDIYAHINVNELCAKLIGVSKDNPEFVTQMGNIRGHMIVHAVYNDIKIGSILDNNIYVSYYDLGSDISSVLKQDIEQIVIKTKGNKEQAKRDVIGAYSKIYPEHRTNKEDVAQYMDDMINQSYAAEQRVLNVGLVFIGISILMSILGMFATAVIGISYKRQHIAIRRICGHSIMMIARVIGQRYILALGLAFTVATPIAHYLCELWLSRYEYRICHPYWIYLCVYGGALLMVIMTIGILTYHAGTQNPSKALREN